MDGKTKLYFIAGVAILYTIYLTSHIGFYELMVFYAWFVTVTISWMEYTSSKIKPTMFGLWTYCCVIMSIIIYDNLHPLEIGAYTLLVQATVYNFWNKK